LPNITLVGVTYASKPSKIVPRYSSGGDAYQQQMLPGL
jgi:hypothetical protein